MNVLINDENRKKLDLLKVGITALGLCCQTINLFFDFAAKTGQHEAIVNWPHLVVNLDFFFINFNHRIFFKK